MIRTHRAVLVLSFSLGASFATAIDSPADLPKKAVERSQITSSGSRPFVLKATVVEITNLANVDYRAEIEEYWMAPDKWRRSVKTNNFSQTLIVNGEKTSEQLIGEYYPNWLRTIISALLDPGSSVKGIDLSQSSDNPMIGGSEVCRRFTFMAGIQPVSNKVFSSFCFDGGLLKSVSMPGYDASYSDYKTFAGKKVAHRIREYIEPGTELEATIKELSELKSPDEALFVITEKNSPLQTIRITEQTLRTLAAGTQEVRWPTVRSGAEKGTLSLYICIDRSGRVREIYDLNSSNAGLSDATRDQVLKWQFKPAVNQGHPVQVEGILTFAFQTATADPIPVLEEEEGLKLLDRRVEPVWPANSAPAGAPIFVTLGVREGGECYGIVSITSHQGDRGTVLNSADFTKIADALKAAVEQWRFRPYVRNGKPTEYQVKVIFYVK